MKTIKDNDELKSYIKNGQITFDCSIKCDFDINVSADIKALNIKAGDIKAWNIEAGNIKAVNIKAWNIEAGNIKAVNIEAWNIKAWNIEAGNIKAGDIEAGNIKAVNIKAGNIKAWNIEAGNISFYAFCISYITLKCKSISGRRENSIFKCLDNEVEYISADKIITIDGKDIKISEESFNELKKQLL